MPLDHLLKRGLKHQEIVFTIYGIFSQSEDVSNSLCGKHRLVTNRLGLLLILLYLACIQSILRGIRLGCYYIGVNSADSLTLQ